MISLVIVSTVGSAEVLLDLVVKWVVITIPDLVDLRGVNLEVSGISFVYFINADYM